MKIALVSRARTYSTPIIELLSKQYDVENKFEIYFDIYWNDFGKTKLLKTYIQKNNNFTYFQNKILELTNKLQEHNNFICKLWPMFITYPPHVINPSESANNLRKNIIFDISKYLAVKNYDKIYVADRNLYDSALSFVYANKTRIWHSTKNIKRSYTKMQADDFTISKTKYYIVEYILHQKMIEYLKKNNIPHTVFEDYNLLDQSQFVKTNNNYENLIYNVEIIKHTIDNYYPLYQTETSDWAFY